MLRNHCSSSFICSVTGYKPSSAIFLHCVLAVIQLLLWFLSHSWTRSPCSLRRMVHLLGLVLSSSSSSSTTSCRNFWTASQSIAWPARSCKCCAPSKPRRWRRWRLILLTSGPGWSPPHCTHQCMLMSGITGFIRANSRPVLHGKCPEKDHFVLTLCE